MDLTEWRKYILLAQIKSTEDPRKSESTCALIVNTDLFEYLKSLSKQRRQNAVWSANMFNSRYGEKFEIK